MLLFSLGVDITICSLQRRGGAVARTAPKAADGEAEPLRWARGLRLGRRAQVGLAARRGRCCALRSLLAVSLVAGCLSWSPGRCLLEPGVGTGICCLLEPGAVERASGRGGGLEVWSLAMAARVSTFAVGCWLLAY